MVPCILRARNIRSATFKRGLFILWQHSTTPGHEAVTSDNFKAEGKSWRDTTTPRSNVVRSEASQSAFRAFEAGLVFFSGTNGHSIDQSRCLLHMKSLLPDRCPVMTVVSLGALCRESCRHNCRGPCFICGHKRDMKLYYNYLLVVPQLRSCVYCTIGAKLSSPYLVSSRRKLRRPSVLGALYQPLFRTPVNH